MIARQEEYMKCWKCCAEERESMSPDWQKLCSAANEQERQNPIKKLVEPISYKIVPCSTICANFCSLISSTINSWSKFTFVWHILSTFANCCSSVVAKSGGQFKVLLLESSHASVVTHIITQSEDVTYFVDSVKNF